MMDLCGFFGLKFLYPYYTIAYFHSQQFRIHVSRMDFFLAEFCAVVRFFANFILEKETSFLFVCYDACS